MVGELSSSETQGQIVGARESLNGRKNMAWRKVKNFEKSPWGLCLTRPVLNGRRPSAFWLGRKTQKFSGTNQKSEWRRPFETGLVRHCPQGLFLPFFTFLHAIFFRPFRLSLAPTLCSWVSENGELSAIKYIYISLTDLKVKEIAWPQNTAINIIYLTEVCGMAWSIWFSNQHFSVQSRLREYSDARWSYCGVILMQKKVTSVISTSKAAGNNKSNFKKIGVLSSVKWVHEITIILGAPCNSCRDWSVLFDILDTLFCRWIHSSFVDFVLYETRTKAKLLFYAKETGRIRMVKLEKSVW